MQHPIYIFSLFYTFQGFSLFYSNLEFLCMFLKYFCSFPILQPKHGNLTDSNPHTFRAPAKIFSKVAHVHLYSISWSRINFHYIKVTSVSIKNIPHFRVNFHTSYTHTCIRMLDNVEFHLVMWHSNRWRVQFQFISARFNCGGRTIPLFYSYRCPSRRAYVRFHL